MSTAPKPTLDMTPSERAAKTRPFSAEKGDERGIIALFEQVFSVKRTHAHFEWKFTNNPYHPPLITVAEDATTGEIVGSYSVMPVQLNVMGKPVLACQSLDTMISADYRMLGLFESTAKECYARCNQAKMFSVHGFPGPMSYPGFMRKLDWRRIATLDEYSTRLSVRSEAKRILRIGAAAAAVDSLFRLVFRIRGALLHFVNSKRSLERLTYETIDRVPADYDAFWNQIKDVEVYSLWKDAKYFAWRLDQNPENKFTYHILRNADGIVAMAVTHERGDTAYICEWLVLDKARVPSDLLLSKLKLQFARRPGIRQLMFQGFDGGFFREAFRSMKREYRSRYVCGLASFENGKSAPGFDLPFNWTITLGDVDFA